MLQNLIYFTAEPKFRFYMNVKIDTKEKFTVITAIEPDLSANMTVELLDLLQSYRNKEVPHLVLNLEAVGSMDVETGQKIAELQQAFYENNQSFVICSLQPAVETMLDEAELLETMNVTPTESEAWDIVQMEEIERELLGDFDEDAGN